ncbi:MAG TPA: hypothetical protein VIQ51_08200 [Chryseosolibacter sp.]
MKKGKKIKEPYEPEDTPNPPQIIEPHTAEDREKPVENKDRPEKKLDSETETRKGRQHLLADETDIDDETTI